MAKMELEEFVKRALESGEFSKQEIAQEILGHPAAAKARNAGASDFDILDAFGLAEPQVEGPMRYVKGVASAAAQGLASAAGLPGDIESLGHTFLPGIMGDNSKQTLGTARDLTKRTNALGLTNRLDLIPRNDLEHYGKAAIEGAAAAGPLAVTGVGLPVMLGTGAIGGLGGEYAHQWAPDNPWAPVLGSIAMGAGGGAALGGIRAAAQSTAHKMSGQVEGLADKIGASVSEPVFGTLAKQSAQNWLEELPSRIHQAYGKVDEVVPPAALVKPQNFVKAFMELPEKDKLASGVSGAIPKTWSELRDLQTTLGETAAHMPPGSGVTKLFEALTSDLRGTAAKVGTGEAFDAGTGSVAGLHKFAQGPLRNIDVGAYPEQIAHQIKSLGPTPLGELTKELPNLANELVSLYLRRGTWGGLAPELKETLASPKMMKDIDSVMTKSVPKAAGFEPGARSMGAVLGALAENSLLPMFGMHSGTGGFAGAGAGAVLAPYIKQAGKTFMTMPKSYPMGGFAAGNALGGDLDAASEPLRGVVRQ